MDSSRGKGRMKGSAAVKASKQSPTNGGSDVTNTRLLSLLESELTKNIFVLIHGVVDALSVHKTVRILVNDMPSARMTLQILSANIVLLIGSILLYQKAILPLLTIINNKLTSKDELLQIDDNVKSVWILYQSLWLLPMCILCYGCSMLWYQDLADSTFKYLKGIPKATTLSKSVGHALYGTLVWLCAFIQVKLLTIMCPLVCFHLESAMSLFFIGVQATIPLTTASKMVVAAIEQMVALSLRMVAHIAKLAGLTLLCLMYGWYAFDPKWIAEGLDPDSRFCLLERYWAYFVGYGLPCVLLLENTSFFVGFGVFLSIFPFCILIGSVQDYTLPYKRYSNGSGSSGGGASHVKDSDGIISIPVFRAAQLWTLSLLQYIDSKYVKSRKQQTKRNVKKDK
jgi:hypothetical protein